MLPFGGLADGEGGGSARVARGVPDVTSESGGRDELASVVPLRATEDDIKSGKEEKYQRDQAAQAHTIAERDRRRQVVAAHIKHKRSDFSVGTSIVASRLPYPSQSGKTGRFYLAR